MHKRLYRSKTNKVITGVCGGIAEYIAIDPVIVRLLWIAISFAFGTGILIYIIASIIMPEKRSDSINGEDEDSTVNQHAGDDFSAESFEAQSAEWRETPKYDKGRTRMVLGIVLVLIGLLALTKEFFNWLDFKLFWPVVLVIAGALILFKGGKKSV
jgi:phage shock protein C